MNDVMKWLWLWMCEDEGGMKRLGGRGQITTEDSGSKARARLGSSHELDLHAFELRRTCDGKGKGRGERELHYNDWIALLDLFLKAKTAYHQLLLFLQ